MVQNAKQKFADTLQRLLDEHPDSTVTITQLAKESGLSRRSFYNNFIDIYDFFFSVHLLRNQDNLDSYLKNRDFYHTILTSLYIFKKYHASYKVLIKTQGPNSFTNALISFAMQISLKLIEQPISDELRFCLEVYWTGISYKLCEWIEQDKNIPPEELTLMIINSMPNLLKPYFLSKSFS